MSESKNENKSLCGAGKGQGGLIVGIDSGVNTGVAVFNLNSQKLELVASMAIHKAMRLVEELKPVLVRVEDARKRKVFGKMDFEQGKFGAGVREGVGSVKRDAKIWEDFLIDSNIPFEMVAPKNNRTKMKAERFKSETGWIGPTNEHGRDAAGLVIGFTKGAVRLTTGK